MPCISIGITRQVPTLEAMRADTSTWFIVLQQSEFPIAELLDVSCCITASLVELAEYVLDLIPLSSYGSPDYWTALSR